MLERNFYLRDFSYLSLISSHKRKFDGQYQNVIGNHTVKYTILLDRVIAYFHQEHVPCQMELPPVCLVTNIYLSYLTKL